MMCKQLSHNRDGILFKEKVSDVHLLSSVLFPGEFVNPSKISFVKRTWGFIRRFEQIAFCNLNFCSTLSKEKDNLGDAV